MAAGDIWQVTCTTLHVRSGPATKHSSVGTLSKGEQVTEISKEGIWVKHSAGWSSTTYMQKLTSVNTTTQNTPVDVPSGLFTDTSSSGSGYQVDTTDILAYSNTQVDLSDFAQIKNIAGVFGLPYQFLPNTDPRLTNSLNVGHIGYEYADKIVERIPLLFLAPGKASFMTKYGRQEKENILEKIIGSVGGSASVNHASVEELLSENGRYYTFEYTPTRYYKFVNPMCRIAARYLNIQDYKLNGESLDQINWEDFTNSGIKSIGDFGTYTSIPFYLDTDTSISESFGNSTTQSMIASTVNSISDMGRELNFLLGYGSTAMGMEGVNWEVDENVQNVKDIISGALGSGHALSSLAGHLTTVASGGKLIFPEIWADSQFSRTYSCKVKLMSPDPSPLSIYLNILVPLFHMIGLVAPQSVAANPNGYTNPFLVRAIYKGFFNVDMGIITSMSITKGAEAQWTPEGIPTSVEINFDIKDLYQAMSITETNATDWRYDTLNNTALMDYIANLCGINIYKPEIARTIEMWYINNFVNRFEDLFKVNIWGGIQEKVQNSIVRFLTGDRG